MTPGGELDMEPEKVFDRVKERGATFCFPHQCVTDALVDRMRGDAKKKRL